MYPLLESIKIKNGFAYHIGLHQERMNRACRELFSKDCEIDLYECLQYLELPESGLHKCRLLYNSDSFKKETVLYEPRVFNSFQIVISHTIDYSIKRSDRSEIEALLEQKNNADDIIIVKNGFITDSSYANLIFYNGKDWFTPSKPLLKGVQREYLLNNGVIKESEIRLENLVDFKSFAIINAMIDFQDKREVPIESVIFP